MMVTAYLHEGCELPVEMYHPKGERVLWCPHGRRWRVTVKEPTEVVVKVEEYLGAGND